MLQKKVSPLILILTVVMIILLVIGTNAWSFIGERKASDNELPNTEISGSEPSNSEPSQDEAVTDTTMVTKVVYDTTADLNHDGYRDYIEVIKIKPANQMENDNYPEESYIQVYLGKVDGVYEVDATYTSDYISDSHSGNGTYVLTEKEGKDYLISSMMYEQMGYASYSYEVMYIEGNQMVTIHSDKTGFCFDPYRYEYWEEPRREDVIPSFKEGLDPWIENAIILVSYDTSTPNFISSKVNVIPANTYYELVWARNSNKSEEEFENSIGKEKWMRDLYFTDGLTSLSEMRVWIDKTSKEDFSQWYIQYDGSKLQSIDNALRYPGVKYTDSIPTNSETIYYRAELGEDAQVAVVKMIEYMAKERMSPVEDRSCTYTAYVIPEQNLAQVSEHMWFLSSIKGYYAYTGTDNGTMEERVIMGETMTEDSLLAFVEAGSKEKYYHILIEKDGVYRLQRLDEMSR